MSRKKPALKSPTRLRDEKFDRLCRCLESGDLPGARRAAKLALPFDRGLHAMFTKSPSDDYAHDFLEKVYRDYYYPPRSAQPEFERKVRRLLRAAKLVLARVAVRKKNK